VRKAIIAPLAALALAGCGGKASPPISVPVASTPLPTTPVPTATVATTTTRAHKPGKARFLDGCKVVRPRRARRPPHLKRPTLTLDPADTYTVTVRTNCGTFAFELDVATSPKTTASFYSLVKRRFFDGLMIFRVATNFVIQGGDPAQDGTGGPGYTVVEPPPRDTEYTRGTVAMARAESQPAGASGSQFFIVTAVNATQSAALGPEYAVLGQVVSGLDVVEAIGRLRTSPPGDGSPRPPVVMSKVTVSVS
jgi:peptidyl-prolyl cis-trans isomerase B (cyclophilin B)